MIEFELRPSQEKVATKGICNMTGEIVDLESSEINKNLLHNFTIQFGYGSDFDNESWSFDLTETALIDLIKKFKIMPEGFAYESKYPEEVFREWKDTGVLNWRAGWSENEVHEADRLREEANLRMENLMKIYRSKKDI